MRNLWFYNAVEAIEQVWDWGWTYKSIHITNCSVGLNMTNVDPAAQNVGSVVLIDSFFANTLVGIATSHDSEHWKVSNGSLILENVGFQNVELAVQGTLKWPALPTNSGNLHVNAWGIGHEYAEGGPQDFLGTLPSVSRVASLTAGSDNETYYEWTKPDYRDKPVSNFISVKAKGAKGDGNTDDTSALQNALDQAGSSNMIVFFDAGTYKVTKTLRLPKTSKIVGESYATIMSSGSFFADMNKPQPVVQVGASGDVGSVEWSDMIVSTQGAQAGAILIEWNVAANGQPSGMWDVHTRIGGFSGSKLGLAECPATIGNAQAATSSNATFSKRASSPSSQPNAGFPVYQGVVPPPAAELASPTNVTWILNTTSPATAFPSSSSSELTSSDLSTSSSQTSTSLSTSASSTSSVSSQSASFDSSSSDLSSSSAQSTISSTSSLSSSTTSQLPSSYSAAATSSTPMTSSFSLASAAPKTISSDSMSFIPSASSTPDPISPYNLTTPTRITPLASNTTASNGTNSNSTGTNSACMGAFMSMHITKSASGLYMENVWLWTADHDLDAAFTNITVYSGRGLLVESEKGDIWM